MTRLWDRGEPLDQLVLRYTAGDDHVLDRRLVPFDIQASAAHAAMLHARGYLSAADHESLQRALASLDVSYARGDWTIALDEEDAHTALENRLVAMCGEAGKRIHLGRSRNDQVLAAMRLYLKTVLEDLAQAADLVADQLDHLGEMHASVPLPGYTHLQRAMPSSVALWAGGFASEIRDDAAGLRAAKRRADKNPLGSAAGYGAPVLGLDREQTTAALDFAETHVPVTAVQLSRGKAEASALFEAALLAQDAARLAADLTLFATAEFAFVVLDHSITTGSSIMPQKRNPDVFELIRGRAAEAWSALHEVTGIVAKLPSGYHRDYQLTKKPLFRGLDGVLDTTRVLAHALTHVHFDPAKTSAAMDKSLFATERAFTLVAKEGMAFRDAYRRVKEEGA